LCKSVINLSFLVFSDVLYQPDNSVWFIFLTFQQFHRYYSGSPTIEEAIPLQTEYLYFIISITATKKIVWQWIIDAIIMLFVVLLSPISWNWSERCFTKIL